MLEKFKFHEILNPDQNKYCLILVWLINQSPESS